MSESKAEPPWLDLALAPWRLALQTWPASLAPQSLTQPINPGWSFGNVINVTEQNSTAPDTEQEILRHHSYGRQIGRMMDAVALLLEHAPAPVKGEARAQALRQVVQRHRCDQAGATATPGRPPARRTAGAEAQRPQGLEGAGRGAARGLRATASAPAAAARW